MENFFYEFCTRLTSGQSFFVVLFSFMIGFVPAIAFTYLLYFLLTLPMRRKERARIFLDLLEFGIKSGQTPEIAIEGAASSGDKSLGARFHLLTAHLAQGLSLSQALTLVPYLLPAQVRSILRTGERMGDLSKVLPACRHLLRDGVSHVHSAMNYLVLMILLFTPITCFLLLTIRFKILPSFILTVQSLLPGITLPAFSNAILSGSDYLIGAEVFIILFLLLALFFYVGGPRVRYWLAPALGGHQILSPWRKRRLKRDFSAMLAVLLDADVPEIEAVRLAGESTASSAMLRRSLIVCQRLQQGEKLPVALEALDNSGELKWRISNALHRGHGFLKALAGWHESLDAKAFQLEQAGAQIVTTCLVLLNGAIIGAIVLSLFLAIIHLINEAVLW